MGGVTRFFIFALCLRRRKNRSGSVSIVVVDKSCGKYKEVKNFGVVSTDDNVNALYKEVREWIQQYADQQTIDFDGFHKMGKDINLALSCINKFLLNALQRLFGKVYDDIGFNCIEDDILRHLGIARICDKAS